MPFWCFSGISLLLWLLIYLFVPETEGRSLEEIQMELKQPRGQKVDCRDGWESLLEINKNDNNVLVGDTEVKWVSLNHKIKR